MPIEPGRDEVQGKFQLIHNFNHFWLEPLKICSVITPIPGMRRFLLRRIIRGHQNR